MYNKIAYQYSFTKITIGTVYMLQIQSPDATGVRGDQQAKARCFYRSVMSLSVVMYATFLYDVLVHLSCLSCKLQKRNTSIAQVKSCVDSTKTILEKYKTK